MTSKIYLDTTWTQLATGDCVIEAQGRIALTFSATAPVGPVASVPHHVVDSRDDDFNYAGTDKAWAQALEPGSLVIVSGAAEQPSKAPGPRVAPVVTAPPSLTPPDPVAGAVVVIDLGSATAVPDPVPEGDLIVGGERVALDILPVRLPRAGAWSLNVIWRNGVAPNAIATAFGVVTAALAPLPDPVPVPGGQFLASLPEMLAFNTAQLPTWPVALSKPLTIVGASNFAYTNPAHSVNSTVRLELGYLLSSAYVPKAVGGALNSEIASQYDAALLDPAYSAGDLLFGATTGNGFIASSDADTQLDVLLPAATQPSVAFFTHTGAGPRNWGPQIDWAERKIGFNKTLNQMMMWGEKAADAAAPAAYVTAARAADMPPPGMTAPFDVVDDPGNASHLGTTGNLELSKRMAIMLRAADGTGAPYIHPQHALMPTTLATGAAVHGVAHNGAVTSWSIVGGNDDAIFSIDAGGVIRRTAAALSGWDGWREVYVVAANAHGQHAGMIRLMDGGYSAPATAPAARITKHLRRRAIDYANVAPIGRQLTIALRYRAPTPVVSAFSLAQTMSAGFNEGNSYINITPNGTVRASFKDEALATTLVYWNGNTMPAGIVATDWITVLISIDGTGDVSSGNIAYLQSNGTATPVTGRPASINTLVNPTADWDSGWQLGEYNGIDASLLDVDFFWVGAGLATDWLTPADYAKFFDPLTGRLPAAFPSDGVIAGFTPTLFVAGGCGEWAVGANRAPGGDVLGPHYQVNKSLATATRAA